MDIAKFITVEREAGLLSGDYNAYRAQAGRRIRTIRRRLGQTTAKGKSYTSKPPVTAENVGKDKQYVQLQLMCSERAWASAMAMKIAQSPENTQKPMPGSTKKQIVSRLNRATQYAQQLLDCLGDSAVSGASETDYLEAAAYVSTLKGALYFEKSRWDSCIQEYSISRVIYVALSASARTDRYKEQLSGTVDPSIRYAAYQLRFPRTKAVPEIARERFPTDQQDLRSRIEKIEPKAFSSKEKSGNDAVDGLPPTISWRQKTVKIEDATIAQAIATANSKEKEAARPVSKKGKKGSARVAAYDEVINSRQEAVDATKAAIDELIAERVDRGDSRLQSLEITRTAVNYAVIELRIGRNRVLVGAQDGADLQRQVDQSTNNEIEKKPPKQGGVGRQLTKMRERTALYDSILQNLDAVSELSGVAGDTSLMEEIDAKRSYFRALKCVTIGRSRAIVGETANALALYSRALELSTSALSLKATHSNNPEGGLLKLNIEPALLQDLHDSLAALVSRYNALVDLEGLISKQKAAAKDLHQPPLADRLDQYPVEDIDMTNLINFPPTLQPVPVKPLFFDLAWNYIDYPGRERAAEGSEPMEGVETEKAPAKKGWFGFGK